jgi:hypothetical protein
MMLLVVTTGLHPTRCVAPRMQQPARQIAVRELQSQADLRVALQETPAMGISLLMLSAPDCAKAAKVKKFLLDRGTPNPLVQHLSLEFMPDDTDNWLAFRGTNPARTPHCIAYDTEGSRVADFVAMTPGALFYGLEDLGGVLAAAEAEQAQDEQRDSRFSPPSEPRPVARAPGTDPADPRLAALESLVSQLAAELGAQQAALGAATLRIAALEEAAGASPSAQKPPEEPVPKGSPPPPPPARKALGSIGERFSDSRLGSGEGFVIN